MAKVRIQKVPPMPKRDGYTFGFRIRPKKFANVGGFYGVHLFFGKYIWRVGVFGRSKPRPKCEMCGAVGPGPRRSADIEARAVERYIAERAITNYSALQQTPKIDAVQ